jgi:hypothetical protein
VLRFLFPFNFKLETGDDNTNTYEAIEAKANKADVVDKAVVANAAKKANVANAVDDETNKAHEADKAKAVVTNGVEKVKIASVVDEAIEFKTICG